jgi:hypothetical protein
LIEFKRSYIFTFPVYKGFFLLFSLGALLFFAPAFVNMQKPSQSQQSFAQSDTRINLADNGGRVQWIPFGNAALIERGLIKGMRAIKQHLMRLQHRHRRRPDMDLFVMSLLCVRHF